MNPLQRALRGLVYVGASNITLYAIGLGSSLVTARLIAPQSFGIVALATFYVTLFGLVRQLGFEQALMNRAEDVAAAAQVHLCLQLGSGLLIGLIATLAYLPLRLFAGPEQALIVTLLAWMALLESWASTYRILLQKELLFGRLSALGVLTTLLGAATTILLGLAGWEVWALVLGNLPARLILTYGYYRACPIKPWPRWDGGLARWFWRFGPAWHCLLAALAILGVTSMDNFVVGTLLGTEQLGYYARAYTWASLPTIQVTWIVSTVALPLYARFQADQSRLSAAFDLTLSMIVRCIVPMGLGLLLLPREIILVLFGERWIAMTPIFQALALYALLRPLSDDAGALLTAVGRMRQNNSIVIGQAIGLVVLEPLVALRVGSVGVALCVGLSYAVELGLLYGWQLRQVLRIDYRRVCGPPLLAGIGATLCVLALSNLYRSQAPLVTLLAGGSTLIGSYVLLLLLAEGKSLVTRTRALLSGAV